MKKNIFIIGTALFASILLFSCTKEVAEDSVQRPNIQSNDNTLLKNKEFEEAPLLYALFLENIISIGGEIIDDDYQVETPLFDGFSRIVYCKVKDNFYEVYVWDSNTNPDFPANRNNNSCTKAWNDGSDKKDVGCYGAGSQCDLELRNGEVIVICCELVV